jgi:hypothetical protein
MPSAVTGSKRMRTELVKRCTTGTAAAITQGPSGSSKAKKSKLCSIRNRERAILKKREARSLLRRKEHKKKVRRAKRAAKAEKARTAAAVMSETTQVQDTPAGAAMEGSDLTAAVLHPCTSSGVESEGAMSTVARTETASAMEHETKYQEQEQQQCQQIEQKQQHQQIEQEEHQQKIEQNQQQKQTEQKQHHHQEERQRQPCCTSPLFPPMSVFSSMAFGDGDNVGPKTASAIMVESALAADVVNSTSITLGSKLKRERSSCQEETGGEYIEEDDDSLAYTSAIGELVGWP